MHRLCAILAVTCGCGRIAFDARSDGGGVDAPLDAPCTLGPFAAPVPYPAPLNDPGTPQWSPWIAADGLSLYFFNIDGAGAELYVATRTAMDQTFGAGMSIPELNSPSREATPTLTADGRTIIFDTGRAGAAAELMIATRADASLPFDPPTFITALNTPSSDQDASLTPDGLELFFQRDSGSATTLWHAVRSDTTQPFTTATELTALEAPSGFDYHVAIAPDGLELFLSSDRPGGAGKADVWVARRSARDAAFAAPVHVPELSSAGDDMVGSLSADGRIAYGTYNADFAAQADIGTATRGCL